MKLSPIRKLAEAFAHMDVVGDKDRDGASCLWAADDTGHSRVGRARANRETPQRDPQGCALCFFLSFHVVCNVSMLYQV